MGKAHRYIMIAMLLIIATCAWLGIKTIFVGDRNIRVPSVVGMRLVEAVDSLQTAGLLAKIDEVDSSERAGTVISQNIPGGEKISKGKVVLLKVSRGGSAIPVPDVRGLKYEEAVTRLSDAGFKIEKVIRVTDKLKPAGTVIAHNPSAPQVIPAGEMITLLISEGSSVKNTFVVVPDLSGQNLAMAKEILEQTGLTAGTVTTVTSDMEQGLIVSSIPKKGAKVPNGTKVNMKIAGTPVKTEPVEEFLPRVETNKARSEAVKKAVEKESKREEIVTKNKPADPAPKPAAPVEEMKTEAVTEAQPEAPKPAAKPKPAVPTKKAKVRYQVPPLVKPMPLRIEMTDGNGANVLKEMSVKGGEYLRIDVNYVGDAIITIYLGGDFVCQDRFN